VLFRQEEAEMRRKMVDADLVECVLGLGPNLFYNSPMESCVVVCRAQKPKARRGKILLINAVNEVTRERAQSFLTEAHQERILRAYRSDRDEPGFSRWVPVDEIRAKDGNLSIPLYLTATEPTSATDAGAGSATPGLPAALESWLASSAACRASLAKILQPDLGA
jgi:type I restriction enzyme M protein